MVENINIVFLRFITVAVIIRDSMREGPSRVSSPALKDQKELGLTEAAFKSYFSNNWPVN